MGEQARQNVVPNDLDSQLPVHQVLSYFHRDPVHRCVGNCIKREKVVAYAALRFVDRSFLEVHADANTVPSPAASQGNAFIRSERNLYCIGRR